ncbi:hypothetical protein QWA68_016768 [Fusarium oxysporum]|nr:hypothetical protein QWA68_016768 [Fusarium oxysporum]
MVHGRKPNLSNLKIIVWVPHLDRVIVSRDVQVDEKVMYDPQLATTLPESGQTLAITINEVDLEEEDIELLSIMENTATSVPVSIQPEAELPRPGLLLTPQISPERSIAGEIQVALPVDEPPTLPRPTSPKEKDNGRFSAPESQNNFWKEYQIVTERTRCNRNIQTTPYSAPNP